jgi:hypothetical protein
MSTWRHVVVRRLLVFAKAVLIFLALLLLAAYFGSHLREAGGTVVQAHVETQSCGDRG